MRWELWEPRALDAARLKHHRLIDQLGMARRPITLGCGKERKIYLSVSNELGCAGVRWALPVCVRVCVCVCERERERERERAGSL